MSSQNEEKLEELEMKEPEAGNLFSIDVLRVTKSAQNQYGLRHGTYQRYRSYCSRRLTRLRKSLNLTNGGKRFQKRVLKAEDVRSVRHLYLPLVQAERAWSYAMQMKDEARLAEDIPPRVKFHIIRRFKKAVKWANTLSTLSKNVVDAKTALEIEAYECWLRGILLLEKEEWKESFNSSAKARTIYEQMVKMGDADEQDLFNDRVMEIDISLRYCNFQLGESEDIKSIIAANHQASGLDLLQAKLESALKESRKKQSLSLDKITWRNRTIPIKSEKLRVALLNSQELSYDLENKSDDSDEKVNSYSHLLSAYSECVEIIKNDIRSINTSKEKSSKLEVEESNLQYLLKYLNFLKVSKALERNELLISSLKSNVALGKNRKKSKPDDFVRIYDSLIQNISELELLSEKDDIENIKVLASRSYFYKAFRCYYLSLSFSYDNEWEKAVAMLQRSTQRANEAKEHFKECHKSFEREMSEIDNLIKQVVSEKTVISSRAYLRSLENNPNNLNKIEDHPAETTISECMDEWVTISNQSKVANFPPEFMPSPCKPVLFDLAQTEISFPDLQAKSQKKSFWKWW